MLNYLMGKDGNYFEIGLGAAYAYYQENTDIGTGCGCGTSEDLFSGEGSQLIGTVTIGYRWQPTDGGFMFRVGLSPAFNKEEFIPFWPYLSLGYTL